MIKNIISIIAGIITAFAISYSTNEDALKNFRFNAGLYDTKYEEKALENTLKLFNKQFAVLFSTSDVGELKHMPAANLVRRRIVQEIRNWAINDQVLIYDKDFFEIEKIELLSPKRAVVVANEVWFMNVKSRKKRYEKSGDRINQIKVRYILRKMGKRWEVIEYEVYGPDDSLPNLNEGVWS